MSQNTQGQLFLISKFFLFAWDRFPALFDSIEGQVSHDDNDASYDGRLGISSYGLSMTTLEEVFLQLGDEEEGDDEDDQVLDNVQKLPYFCSPVVL